MRDRTILRANVTRPAGEGRFPVLPERTPHNKEGGSENTIGSPQFYAARGYAVVIQDVRGRFASDGDFYPFRDDGAGTNRDGYDTIQWAAAQPWSTGNVGTIGGSYSGATQYRNALSRPPHLRAMFIRESSADYYQEWVYRGGAFELGFNMGWARDLIYNNLPHLATGAEHDRRKGILERAAEEQDDWYARLPLFPNPVLDGLGDWYNDWLAHPNDGPYWWQINVQNGHDQIEAPIYHLGGWFDIFLGGTLKHYVGLKRRARTASARRSQKLIIGPWVHGPANVDNQFAGEFDFGPDAAVKVNELRLPWFDYHLKGIDSGIKGDPPVRIFVMGSNQWRTEADWPLPDTRYTPYYLRAGATGSINSLNDATLSAEPPESAENPDSYVYDPDNPVPSKGGHPEHSQRRLRSTGGRGKVPHVHQRTARECPGGDQAGDRGTLRHVVGTRHRLGRAPHRRASRRVLTAAVRRDFARQVSGLFPASAEAAVRKRVQLRHRHVGNQQHLPAGPPHSSHGHQQLLSPIRSEPEHGRPYSQGGRRAAGHQHHIPRPDGGHLTSSCRSSTVEGLNGIGVMK